MPTTQQNDDIDKVIELLGFEKSSDSSWFDTPTGYDVTEIINNAREAIQRLIIDARIDQAKRTRGTMYVNAPNIGYEKVGKEIELLEAQDSLNTKQEGE